MIDDLGEIYEVNDHFFLRSTDNSIKSAVNIPSDPGVYVIYSLNRSDIELVYIGSSTGIFESTGLKEHFLSIEASLKSKIKKEDAAALDIYWFVTKTSKKIDDPKKVETQVIRKFTQIFGRKPRWNK